MNVFIPGCEQIGWEITGRECWAHNYQVARFFIREMFLEPSVTGGYKTAFQ